MQSQAVALAAAQPRFTLHPDGRSLDHERIYRAADGSLYCLEWSPTLNPDNELPQAECVALAQACSLDPNGGAWDAPTDFELQGALDRSHAYPAVPPELAPHVAEGWHWSKTEHASVSSGAWGVDFGNGYVGSSRRSVAGFVRAVRRVPASQS